MARSYYVELTCQTSASPHSLKHVPADQLEKLIDGAMDALLDEPGIEDADIGANLAEGRVTFCVHLDADDSSEALRLTHVRVRSALHKTGAGTPGWEQLVDDIRNDEAATKVRPAELGELIDC